MEETQASIFDNFEEAEHFLTPRRIDLLPWWIKVCSWFFIFIAGIGLPVLIYAFLGGNETMQLFGSTTTDVAKIMGIILFIWLILKGVTAYGLLTGKKWAIVVATVDAIINLLLSIFTVIEPFIDNQPGYTFHFRFEIFILICYLWKLNQISSAWYTSRP